MSPTSRRKVDVERLGYHPAKPHPYDLEIFRVANLKRRTPGEAMKWTYSYEFYMLMCVTEGRCVQMVDFEPISCSAGTLLALRPGQAHNFDQHITDGDDMGAYDYDSLMHYGRHDFAINPALDTITPTPNANRAIGQRTGLSAGGEDARAGFAERA